MTIPWFRLACVFFCVTLVRAELPLARLHSLFPAGGRQGTSLQVNVEGLDLDDAATLRFTGSGITAYRNATNPPGLFTVTIASNTVPGLYEARVVSRFGLTNPRFFQVGSRPESLAPGDHHTFEKAMALPADSTVNAIASAAAADYYRIEVSSNATLTIVCEGEPFDSRFAPVIFLFNRAGQELLRDRHAGRLEFTPSAGEAYILKVHDLTYRGGKQFPYRLTVATDAPGEVPPRLARLPVRAENNLEVVSEQESNDRSPQMISPPCEIQGRFYPERDVDSYEFIAKKGEVFWIDVRSDRLGEPTAPFVLVQKISENSAEAPKDVQELYGSDSNLGGPLFNTATRDPLGKLEIKEDGRYRIQVRDLFNTKTDTQRAYRLVLRHEDPGFELIALVLPPPDFNKDDRRAQVWSSFLRRGETTLLKVLALRRDGFNGEITLKIEGLPDDIHPSESFIAEGQNHCWLTLTATNTVADWTGAIRIVGEARAGTNRLQSVAHAAGVVWDIADYNNESVRSRLESDLTLATSSDVAPLAIELKQTSWQVSQIQTIPVHLARSPEFKQPIKLRVYADLQSDPIKDWQVDGNVADTTFDFDAKQAKLAPGPHLLYFLAQTAGKIRRVRPDEVPALEAAAKVNEAQRKQIEERLQWRDVSATFSSPIIKIFVNPAPTAAR